jgi:hypothetical protein
MFWCLCMYMYVCACVSHECISLDGDDLNHGIRTDEVCMHDLVCVCVYVCACVCAFEERIFRWRWFESLYMN